MPTFQTLNGVTFFAPSTIVDVQNELVEPSALEKSLVVFGDFPELKKGDVYTSIKGGAQVSDAYPNIPSINRLSKLWRLPLSGIDGFAERLSFVNCGANTQAAFEVPTEADAAINGASFKARYYGLKGNMLRVRLETPDTPTGDPAGIGLDAETEEYYRVVASGSGFERRSHTFGLPNQIFVTYTDTEAADIDGTITIAQGTIRIQTGAVDVTHTLEDFSSLDELKDAIEAASPKFSVVVNRYDVKASQLDEGVYTFDDDAAGNTPVEVKLHAHVYALEQGIKTLGHAVPYELELADGRYRHLEATAGNADADPLTFIVRTTDGTESAATVADYRGVLTDGEVLGKDFTSCTVMSTSSSVHKLLQDYLETSYANQKERNGFIGTPSDLDLESVYQLYVKPRSSAMIAVVAQDIEYADHQNNAYDGDTTDCAFLAMCAHGALPFGAAATRKNLNIISTSQVWNKQLDIHKVAQKNIWGITQSESNQQSVIRSLTSFVKDNLPQNNEVGVRESIDASSRDIRKYISTELGSTITSATANKLKDLVKTRLALHRDRGIIRNFANVSVNIVDDVAYIEYDLSPTQSINFIRITSRIRRDI
jgi:hypothetical protein